jgi:hypothetical protein
MYVFSSNASPLDSEKSYSKFEAYTFLNHDGNFQAAARALKAQGYGGGPPTLTLPLSPADKYHSLDLPPLW